MAERDAALIPLEEKAIEFYEDLVTAVAVEQSGERRIYVPVKPIVTYLGLDWPGQYQRIQRDPILSEVITGVVITTIPDPERGGGGPQETLCLPIEMLHGYLFGIQANRVRPEIRDKVLRYQRECYRALYEAFHAPEVTSERTSEAMMRAMRDNALQQARLWESLLEEQRRLRITENVVQEHEGLIWEAFSQLDRLRQEQSRLGARFNDLTRLLPAPLDAIGPAQKAAIKELVDDIVAAAQERGVRLGQGRNDYPAVWGALKQRFDVAKYDELTVGQYEEVIQWLKAWLERLQA